MRMPDSFPPIPRSARAWVIVCAAAVGAAGAGSSGVQAAEPPDFDRPDARAEEALRVWEPGRALRRIGALVESGRANAYLYLLHAKLLFHAGRYEEALKSAAEAERRAPKDKRVLGWTAFIRRTLKARKGFRVHRSERFELHLAPGRDAPLVEFALRTAERSHLILAPFFGMSPAGAAGRRIRIEVYPTAERFHWASNLSRRDIEVTGAVGITAFNKIMVISPRALTRGYRWADTLSHEYVHYLLVAASKNNAPIWFHEGLAKFLEARWRSLEDLYLGPVPRTLLAEAVRDGEFVSFQKMEPSLVRLPNPRMVQLAYAEGASAIDYILRRHGRGALLAVIRDLASSPKRKLAAAIRGDWEDYLQANVIGTYNVFEAARLAGAKRVVYASSGAVTAGWERSMPFSALAEGKYEEVGESWDKLTHQSPTRPRAIYGCTKVWGEALARHFSDTYDISVICLRIGAVNRENRPTSPRHFSVWCSQDDIAQMVEKCIEAPDDLQFDTFFVVSDNKWSYRDISHSQQVVGYQPQDAAEEHRKDSQAQEK